MNYGKLFNNFQGLEEAVCMLIRINTVLFLQLIRVTTYIFYRVQHMIFKSRVTTYDFYDKCGKLFLKYPSYPFLSGALQSLITMLIFIALFRILNIRNSAIKFSIIIRPLLVVGDRHRTSSYDQTNTPSNHTSRHPIRNRGRKHPIRAFNRHKQQFDW